MHLPAALLVSALAAFPVSAQTAVEQSRTLRLAHSESTQQLQEMATVIRSIADIRQLTTDAERRQISLRGTTDQIALADWLAARLDLAGSGLPHPAKHEYRLPDGAENVVRVFYFANVAETAKLQEAATLMRAIVQVRRMFIYPSRNAIAVRGTESQAAIVEWLAARLDRPTAPQGTHECRGERDDNVCVFHLVHADEPRKLQELAVMIRSTGDIRQLFTYNPLRAIALRGDASQIAIAGFLVRAIDRPDQQSAGPGPHQYQVPGGGDDLVRVFYVANAATPQRLHQIAVEARTASGVPRLFTNTGLSAISARGTAGQIEAAARVIEPR